ncbi:hypothetical protein [Desulfovibrio litoralis]|uniref:Uncharacterized protein n=1 Tax=Desulfovibrio litoralis DSM 11393 TaxID=1121455 RepID=A0A1M7T7N1_9BACT|nr:hypothetical protein [Desulfovibrio litoralis]SHN66729.1 hypothetical protein SAMN02745728_01683 [Desulfovibrio litoralis DSM 11393]
MNTDFRVQTDFLSHHKTKKLKRRLGSDGIICLIALWSYTANHRSSGILSCMSIEDIEIAVDWEGGEGEFVTALFEIGFLEFENDTYILHNWLKHNPWVAEAEERSEKARAAAHARWGVSSQKNKTNKDSELMLNNATASSEHMLNHANALNEQCPSPLLSYPNQDKKEGCIKKRECINIPREAEEKNESHTPPVLGSEKNLTPLAKPEAKQDVKQAETRQPKAEDKKLFGDFVKLSEKEYQELIKLKGKELTHKAIEKLNFYIGSKGKDDYKSHYFALLKWAFKAVAEDEAKALPARASPADGRASGRTGYTKKEEARHGLASLALSLKRHNGQKGQEGEENGNTNSCFGADNRPCIDISPKHE